MEVRRGRSTWTFDDFDEFLTEYAHDGVSGFSLDYGTVGDEWLMSLYCAFAGATISVQATTRGDVMYIFRRLEEWDRKFRADLDLLAAAHQERQRELRRAASAEAEQRRAEAWRKSLPGRVAQQLRNEWFVAIVGTLLVAILLAVVAIWLGVSP